MSDDRDKRRRRRMRNNHARALHEGRNGQFRPRILEADPKRRVTREEWEAILEEEELEEYWPDELEDTEEDEDDIRE